MCSFWGLSWKPGRPQEGAKRLLHGSILEAKKTPVWRQEALWWVHLGGQEVPKRVPMCSFLSLTWKPGRPQEGAKTSWVYLRGQEDPSMAPKGTLVGPSWKPGSPQKGADVLLLGFLLEARKTPRERQEAPFWVYLKGQDDPSMAPRGTLVGPSWRPGSPQKGANVLLLGFILEARKTPRGRQEAPSWVYLRGQEDPSMAPRGALL